MKRKIFFYCLLMVFTFSCGDKVTETKIRSYVVLFFSSNDLRLELTSSGNIAMYWSEFNEYVSFESKGADVSRYDELCKRYNDLNYNRKTRYLEYLPCREYSSNEIVSIDVVSNVDFDAQHPAGSSLGDVVRLLSASPIRFIQSGYKETYDWHTHYPQEFLRETSNFHLEFCSDFDGEVDESAHHFPVNGTLAILKQNDLQLLGKGHLIPYSPIYPGGYYFGYLTFEKEPDTLGIHELTVTVHFSDGSTLTQTIEKSFGNEL